MLSTILAPHTHILLSPSFPVFPSAHCPLQQRLPFSPRALPSTMVKGSSSTSTTCSTVLRRLRRNHSAFTGPQHSQRRLTRSQARAFRKITQAEETATPPNRKYARLASRNAGLDQPTLLKVCRDVDSFKHSSNNVKHVVETWPTLCTRIDGPFYTRVMSDAEHKAHRRVAKVAKELATVSDSLQSLGHIQRLQDGLRELQLPAISCEKLATRVMCDFHTENTHLAQRRPFSDHSPQHITECVVEPMHTLATWLLSLSQS